MTRTEYPGDGLPILVDGLVTFLREQQKLQAAAGDAPAPEGLERVFQTFAHHVVALMLVARSDDKVAASERQVISGYCRDRARKAGLEMTDDETDALADYLRRFQPSLMQLSAAIEKLRHDPKDDIAALVDAARAVVEADGVVRLQEALYFESLRHDLMAL